MSSGAGDRPPFRALSAQLHGNPAPTRRDSSAAAKGKRLVLKAGPGATALLHEPQGPGDHGTPSSPQSCCSHL